MRTLKKESGFTLIEMMMVVAIIGLLVVIAYPNYTQARNSARTKICTNNLRLIYAAKEQWAMDTGSAQGVAVIEANVLPYLKANVIPTEPGGGTYTIGNVGENPTCSVGGTHSL